MRGRFQLKPSVRVKQTVTLRNTLKMASLGTSAAGVICLLMVIAFNSNTSNVVAGNQGKSFMQSVNEFSSILSAEYENNLKENNEALNSQLNNLAAWESKTGAGESVTPFIPTEDFIHIYPKNTSGIFNIEFRMPEKGNFTPQIELVNRKGKVIEKKIIQPDEGKVMETFIMDNNLPNGAYLVRVSINRQLYIRQVVLQRQ